MIKNITQDDNHPVWEDKYSSSMIFTGSGLLLHPFSHFLMRANSSDKDRFCLARGYRFDITGFFVNVKRIRNSSPDDFFIFEFGMGEKKEFECLLEDHGTHYSHTRHIRTPINIEGLKDTFYFRVGSFPEKKTFDVNIMIMGDVYRPIA